MVRIATDNTTAVWYINKQGGTHSLILVELVIEIWRLALYQGAFLKAEHIPGKDNIQADYLSRMHDHHTEWMLDPLIARGLIRRFHLRIDLFASHLNCQMDRFVSWKFHTAAVGVDAMSMDWRQETPYMFPPLKLLLPILRKVQREHVRALIVAPAWATQPYFPLLQRLLVSSQPLYLPHSMNLVTCLMSGLSHPLKEKLHLAAWLIQG